MSLELGYPPRQEERELLISGGVQNLLADLGPVVSLEELLDLQRRVATVTVAERLADYMLAIADRTRTSEAFALGVSTRAAQSLFRATQALAFCEGRDFALPDDVQRLAVPVLSHRVMLTSATGLQATRLAMQRVIAEVPVPV